MEEIEKKAAQKCFEKHCYSKGIYGVNQHTAFRWDEVIEFMVVFANQQNKSTKEREQRLVEACSKTNILTLLKKEVLAGNIRCFDNDFDIAERFSKQLQKQEQ